MTIILGYFNFSKRTIIMGQSLELKEYLDEKKMKDHIIFNSFQFKFLNSKCFPFSSI